MNRYPVLFISFKDVEGESFESAFEMMTARLADVCKELADCFEGKKTDADDEQILLRLKAQKASVADI